MNLPSISAADAIRVTKDETTSSDYSRDSSPEQWYQSSNSNVATILREYTRQHSYQQLQKEIDACSVLSTNETVVSWNATQQTCPHLAQRRFVVGYLGCPDRAGNRLHCFLNSLGLAIMTNRTFLYQYHGGGVGLTRAGDEAFNCTRDISSEKCRNVATEMDQQCNSVLSKAEWMPSAHDILPQLRISADDVGYFDRKMRDLDACPARVALYTHLFPLFQGTDWQSSSQIVEHFHGRGAQTISEALVLSHGARALYGLLFYTAFSFSPNVMPSHDSSTASDDFTVSVAVHSRHTDEQNDGSNITGETQCLTDTLRRLRKQKHDKGCAVYLLSDRIKSVENMIRVVRSLNCTPFVANNSSQTSPGRHAEHGPFAGIGFYRDLALASRARHGFVGSSREQTDLRTSSLLLLALVEAGRVMDNDDTVSDVEVCKFVEY